ncbi:MAG: hypothetical protein CL760_12640 [Chloroflexi bacterium]|nr:hypothetical protein [Chloroflexota bacterium]|tara:strand:+ start:13762 stop:14103 length:342 start_codon:yes stop_codon:yes gene_type:complete
MKIEIQKFDESSVTRSKFKVDVEFYFGGSEYHTEEVYFNNENEVIDFYKALKEECAHWTDHNSIKNQDLKETLEYIIDEMGLTDEIRFDDGLASFSISWFDEHGREHKAKLIK